MSDIDEAVRNGWLHKDAEDEIKRLRAERDALRKALLLAVDAMRAPLDDWKGVVERRALDVARTVVGAALAEEAKTRRET